MPQWEAELSDGRTVVLEADSEPTEEAILGGLQDYETAQSKTGFKDLSADQPLKLARPRMDVGFPTTAGGPRVPVASLAETLAEPKEEMEPRIQLPEAKVTEQDSPLSVVGKEAWNLAKGIPEFFSSTPGLLAAFAGPGAPALTSGLFAGQMFTDLGQQLVSTYKDWDQLSRNQKIKAVVDMVGTGAMGGLLAKHATSGVLDQTIPARALAKQISQAPIEPPADLVSTPIRIPGEPIRAPFGAVAPENLLAQIGLLEPKPEIAPKPPIARAPSRAFRPTIPETPPEPQRGLTVLEEIRARNARTKEQIRVLFPQLSREEAAELRRQAWDEPPPEPPAPSGAPVGPPPKPPTRGPATPADILGRVQDLRPAVKTMEGEVVEGDKGQTHNEIIKDENIPATDVDRREFVDTQTGQEVSREQVATAIPTERPGEAHSTDLSEAQKAEEQARLAAELGQEEEAPPEAKVPTPSDLALQTQREAGWNPDWPFVPADFGNKTFRDAIESDPTISAAEKDQMFSAAEKLLGGKIERTNQPEVYQSILGEMHQVWVKLPDKPAINVGSVEKNPALGEKANAIEAAERAWKAREAKAKPAPPEAKAPTPSDVPAEQSAVTAPKRQENLVIRPRTDDMVSLQDTKGSHIGTFKTADEAAKWANENGYGIAAGSELKPTPVAKVTQEVQKVARTEGQPPGPGAQTAGEPKYAAIQQLTDQLNAAKPVGARERLSVREKMADAWAQGKSLVDRAVGRSRAVSQTVKEMARGVRDVTDLDRQVRTLDYLLQRSAGQSIENGKAIKRQMRNKPMREAVALWIDANGDTAAIRDTLSNLKPGIRPNVRRALEAALKLSPEAKEFAESLKQFFGIREQDAIASDVFERGLEDYFTHIWQKETNMPDSMRAAVSNGRVNDYFQFARQRKLSTFLEGINQGKNPILDPAKVVPYYNYALDRAIASRQFIKALSDLDAPDGRPAVLPSGTAARMGSAEDPAGMAINPRGKTELGRDYRTIDHPALRKWKWIGKDENGNPIMYRSDLAVNPAMYERLARMLDRGRMTPTEWGRRALRASTEVKGMKLGLLSAFHQVHVGSHALWHWTNPFDTKPIDWDSPGARFAIEQGHLKIAADPGQLAEMSEGILGGGSTLVQKIPVLGPWARAYSEWLFGDYIPRLKLKTFENAYDRNLKWYAKDIASGKETPETIAARVGDSVNNAYGELNHWFLGKYGRDPRFQRLLRGIFLAPDFGEARLRFVEKAFTKLGNEERLALATMFVTMYTASRVGNWLSHGDPEWEAKNMFRVKVGNHWISARSVVGDVAHALTNASQFMYVRLNPLYARTASDLLFRRDLNGRKLAWTDVLLKRPAEQLIPIQFSNLTRDDQNLWESFISSMGLQSRHDTPQGDVRQMVRKFMAASNDPKLKERADRLDQEIFAPSVYAKLRTALLADNKEKAQVEFGKLLKTRSRDQIFKAMDQSRHPYSGSWEVESAFLGSLKPKEREAYARARAEQAAIYQRFLQIASLPEK